VSLDFVVVVGLLICFAYGLIRGLLTQIIALVALVIGFAAAWLVTALMERVLGSGSFSSATLTATAATAVFLVAYIAVLRLGKNLVKARALAFSTGVADRLLGGAFSLMEGAVVALLLISFFDCIGEDFLEKSEGSRIAWSESRVAQWAHRHNAVARLRPVRRLNGLFTALRDPASRELLRSQPAYAALTSNTRYRAVRDDSELQREMENGDWITALQDLRVQKLLADEPFWGHFFAVKWEASLSKTAAPIQAQPPSVTPSSLPAATAIPEATPSPASAPGLSTVFLKGGSVLEGRIAQEGPEGILMDVSLEGGTMRMSITAGEIERIKRAESSPSGGR
jgi:uncharacterized membrane protein required for colicin V production